MSITIPPNIVSAATSRVDVPGAVKENIFLSKACHTLTTAEQNALSAYLLDGTKVADPDTKMSKVMHMA